MCVVAAYAQCSSGLLTIRTLIFLLLAMLNLYASRGEHWIEREQDSYRKAQLEKKKDDSKLAASKLVQRVPSILQQKQCLPAVQIGGGQNKRSAGVSFDSSEAVATGFSPDNKRAKVALAGQPKGGVPATRDLSADPRSVINSRVAKYFPNPDPNGSEYKLYFGTVKEYLPPSGNEDQQHLWNVFYEEDGDSEDLSIGEIKRCLKLYGRNKNKDPMLKAPKRK